MKIPSRLIRFFSPGGEAQARQESAEDQYYALPTSEREQVSHNRWNHWARIVVVALILVFVGVWVYHAYDVFLFWRQASYVCIGHAADFCGAAAGHPGVIIAVITSSTILTLALFGIIAKLLSPVAYSHSAESEENKGDSYIARRSDEITLSEIIRWIIDALSEKPARNEPPVKSDNGEAGNVKTAL